ncbi:glycoside hydrolase family 16 protein [Chitinophaga pendula]|uniref:glycoside hydrolase family 16 protein n=1 Tax=Chitinophaga TaxID=79328 RepID=UPI000BAFACF6|nr:MULTISPECIES: glycoside hydrolase family 16 protein [Chitinophaga]ASZ12226.1 hypothetical protein CK934_15285 [Chitinophaga sp. MD30]UCJ04742.1 glycoside hydrolase family 16 protein [Chitinophaga pendula]
MYKFMTTLLLAAALISCSKDVQPDAPGDATANNRPPAKTEALTINWSGYTWNVKQPSGTSGPGNNYWSPDNVWVDAQGRLHLKIKREPSGRWTCAEIYSTRTFGYGSYVWKVEGRVDKLDRNIVFGLFNYKSGDDGHHEVDVEFARWGNDASHNFNYTVYPAYGDPATRDFQTYELALNGTYSTYRFNRNSTRVAYKSFHGHTENESNAFYAWTTRAGFPVSTEALPVHLNLWLFQGQAPANGQEVELIVHSFTYTPQ